MTIGTAAVLLFLVILVVLIIRGLCRDHQNGKFITCSHDCSSCAGCCRLDAQNARRSHHPSRMSRHRIRMMQKKYLRRQRAEAGRGGKNV